jgi:hypothetical protein
MTPLSWSRVDGSPQGLTDLPDSLSQLALVVVSSYKDSAFALDLCTCVVSAGGIVPINSRQQLV